MRKMQILLCAMNEFSRSNYRATKVADIAREAGISEAMIYKLFPTKRSLFLGTLDLLAEQVLAVLEEERARKTNSVETLRNMGYMHIDRLSDLPESIHIQFQALAESSDKEIKKKLNQYYEDIIKIYQETIAEGMAEGNIRDDLDGDAITLMLLGSGLIMNFEHSLCTADAFDRDLARKMVDRLADFISV